MAARIEWGFLLLILAVGIILFFITGLVLAIILIVRWANRHQPETPQAAQTRKTLAETLKEYRTRSGMTQEAVAEAVGVSRQSVSKWELGASEPSTTNLIALAELYNTSPDELLSALTKKPSA